MNADDRPTAALSGTRFVFVIGNFRIGGAEGQAIMLARMFKERGAEVEVWAFYDPGPACDLCVEYGIPWRTVPIGWGSGRLRQCLGLMRLAWELRRAKPDVIFSYNLLSNVVCGVTWQFSKAKIWIWTQRSSTNNYPVGRRLERFAVSRGCTMISNSEGGADLLVRELGVDRAAVHVVSNGVTLPEPELDRIGWRAKLGINKDCFAACMVANLRPPKDHVTLLRAWRVVMDRFRAQNREAVLLLAGRLDVDGPLRKLCSSMEMNECVRFLGPVRDIAGLLGACDIGVHSSLSEGCPNAVLECMAAGLPVAGTDIPEIGSVVGINGLRFLAPPGDAATLADRILELASDLQLRHTLGMANYRRAKEEYSPQKMCDDTLSIVNAAWAEGKK